MPNKRISSGVISEPPPTPVMPTRRPTPKPEATYRGSITDADRALARWPSQRFLHCSAGPGRRPVHVVQDLSGRINLLATAIAPEKKESSFRQSGFGGDFSQSAGILPHRPPPIVRVPFSCKF